MTETRKQIIELIEFYMDKTLSEGCLYIIDDSNSLKIFHKVGTSKMVNDSGWIDRIIGHYDITAVLKYITETGRSFGMDIEFSVIEIIKDFETIGKCPYKPLNLYTEQEEKDLLELLLELKK